MIKPEMLAAIFHQVHTMAPTVIVHPVNEDEIRAAIGDLRIPVTIQVTELAKPGEVTVFSGTRMPILNLGDV